MDAVRREKAQLEQLIEHEHLQVKDLKQNSKRKSLPEMESLSEMPEEEEEEEEEEENEASGMDSN